MYKIFDLLKNERNFSDNLYVPKNTMKKIMHNIIVNFIRFLFYSLWAESYTVDITFIIHSFNHIHVS